MQGETTVEQQNILAWMFHALGPMYILLLPLAGLTAFVLAFLIVTRGRGPMAAAALVLVVHIPLLVGLFGVVHGMLASLSVIAQSSATPKPAEIAQGISLSLFAAIVGMFLCAPAYLTAAIGSFARCMKAKSDT